MVQPVNMEILNNFKTYCVNLVNYILGAYEENLLTSSSTFTEVGARINLLQVVHFVADNWPEISSQTIQNCFAHRGFKHLRLEIPNTSGIENEATLEIQSVRNHEDLMQRQ
jgi:hypothetical protein